MIAHIHNPYIWEIKVGDSPGLETRLGYTVNFAAWTTDLRLCSKKKKNSFHNFYDWEVKGQKTVGLVPGRRAFSWLVDSTFSACIHRTSPLCLLMEKERVLLIRVLIQLLGPHHQDLIGTNNAPKALFLNTTTLEIRTPHVWILGRSKHLSPGWKIRLGSEDLICPYSLK